MGRENTGIAYYVLSNPLGGPRRGSIIVGASVHNQRIERFWRDLFIGCTGLFYHLFYHLEQSNLLDPNGVLSPVLLTFCIPTLHQLRNQNVC